MICSFACGRSNDTKGLQIPITCLVNEAIYASNSVARTAFFPFFPPRRFLPPSHEAPPAFFGGAVPEPAVPVAVEAAELVAAGAEATELAELVPVEPVPVEPEPVPVESPPAAAVKRIQSS